MKIAIPIVNKSDNPLKINEKFGRCPFFYLLDMEKNNSTFLDNEKNINSAHGSGIQTSSLLAQNGVNVVIVRELGPKAYDTLKESNVKIYKADDKTNKVDELINMYKKNLLEEVS